MMDLSFEYLIFIILLFSTNICLLVRDLKWNNGKFYLLLFSSAAFIFVCSSVANYLPNPEILISFMPEILFVVCILVLIATICHLLNWKANAIDEDLKMDANNFTGLKKIKKDFDNKFTYGMKFNGNLPLLLVLIGFAIAVLAFSLVLEKENMFLAGGELAVLSIVIMFLVYKVSRILTHAKRGYSVVIGEYMFLEFILLLIFALTFTVIRNLDFSIFGSLLILTPTYQVLYMVLALAIMVVLGVLYNNERTLKKLKRK